MRWLWHLGQFADMMALLIEITVEANTWAALELAREPVETF
jgi:hypothetical protein